MITDIVDLFWYSAEHFLKDTLKDASRYVEVKKTRPNNENNYNILNEIIDIKAKYAEAIDKINRLQTEVSDTNTDMKDMKETFQHEIETLNGRIRLVDIRQINIGHAPINSSPALPRYMLPSPIWMDTGISTSPVLQPHVMQPMNNTPPLLVTADLPTMNNQQTCVQSRSVESVQQQVHIPHSKGQHKDNTDQLIEAESTQPDESSVNTSSPSDSSQSFSNVSLLLIQNSHTSNYSNGSESESLKGSTYAFVTCSIAEITMSNISNNSQANQVQNVGNTTYDINDNDNTMSRRSYTRVVTHDGRWVSMPIQTENNKSSNHINNVSTLKGAK